MKPFFGYEDWYLTQKQIKKYVDPGILELVLAMNTLPYVQTDYSCSGHFEWHPEGYILLAIPALDFFADIHGRYTSESDGKRAHIFVTRFKNVVSRYKCENIPSPVRHYLKERHSDDPEELADQLSNLVPFFSYSKAGYCIFNGSQRSESRTFRNDALGRTAARILRRWHRELIHDLERMVKEEVRSL